MMHLIAAIKELPDDWSIVPVIGKQPIGGKGWNRRPYSPSQLIHLLSKEYYRCTGVGILTGVVTECAKSALIAVDRDGEDAAKTLNAIAKGRKLPQTVAFSSGRPSRCQQLFKVACSIAPKLRSRKLEGGLELRFSGLMSVLPPSIHPNTKKPYHWLSGCSPSETAIANAPDWLIQPMECSDIQRSLPIRTPILASKNHPDIHQSNRARQHSSVPRSATTHSASEISTLLSRLAPRRADDYNDWIRVGLALYSESPDFLPIWERWSQQSHKWQEGVCVQKWNTFHPKKITIGTLYYLAKLDSALAKN